MADIRAIAKIKPMGDFAIADVEDIDFSGIRLDVVINQVRQTLTDIFTAIEENENNIRANSGKIDANTAAINDLRVDLSTAEAAIASKASQAEVNAIKSDVATKASTSTVSALQTDMAVQKSRMDQLVGTVPAGSADEIADARVKIDGTVAGNLGDAIRSQVSSLKETINNNIDEIDILKTLASNNLWNVDKHSEIVDGYYWNSKGQHASNVQTFVCDEYLDAEPSKRYTCSGTTWFAWYTESKTFIKTDGVASEVVSPSNARYMRIATALTRKRNLKIAVGDYVEYATAAYEKVNELEPDVDDLKSKINQVYPEMISEFSYSIPMEIGALDGYGNEIPGTTRARATVFLPFFPGLNILIPDGYKARLLLFEDGVFKNLSTWKEDKLINVDDFARNKSKTLTTTFRLLVGKIDDSDISVAPDIYYVSNPVKKLDTALVTDRIRVVAPDFAVSNFGPYVAQGYYTSIPVPVETGLYKCYAARNYVELDENLVTLSLASGGGGENVTISNPDTKYIVFCWRDTDPKSDFMCFSKAESFIGGYDTVHEETSNGGKYAGKLLVWTGDSIPHGQVGSGTAPKKPYPQIVAENLGMRLKNYSIGGSTIAHKSSYGGAFKSTDDFNSATKDTSKYYQVITGQTYVNYKYSNGSWVTDTSLGVQCRTPLIDRFQLMDDDADIVCVAAGTNDFQYNWTDIGEVAEVGRIFDKTTFIGALQYLCESLLIKYKGKKIIFCTPIKRAQTRALADAPGCGDYPLPTSRNTKDKSLKDYGDIIKDVCALYSIPVIDLYAISGLNPSLNSQSEFFDTWKTHPFQNGHDLMGEVATAQIKTFINV